MARQLFRRKHANRLLANQIIDKHKSQSVGRKTRHMWKPEIEPKTLQLSIITSSTTKPYESICLMHANIERDLLNNTNIYYSTILERLIVV